VGQKVRDEAQSEAVRQQAQNADENRKRTGQGYALVDRVDVEQDQRRGKDRGGRRVGADDELARRAEEGIRDERKYGCVETGDRWQPGNRRIGDANRYCDGSDAQPG
jgi:hypothetical protein